MSQARDKILNRLRKGAATAFRHPNTRSEREQEWWARQPPMADPAARFLEELDKVGTAHVEVPHWEALPAAVSPWFGEHHIGSVMTGAVPELEPLREHLAAELGLSPHTYTEAAEAQLEELFTLDCGITTARAGIAETGSLLLIPDALQPRLLSLALPVHLALVERNTLYPTLGHYLATDEYRVDPPANLVLISGASRTADIELTLSVGVHGPKVLLVALIG